MIAFEQVQRGSGGLREAHAVLERNHIVAPAMHDRRRTVQYTLAKFGQTLDVERRCHQEDAASVQQRSGCDGDVPAHAGANQNEITRQFLARVDELRHTCPGLIDAAIVDRVRLIALAARHFRERRDLPTPGSALLSMRENHIPRCHARTHDGWSCLCMSLRVRISVRRGCLNGRDEFIWSE